MKKILKQKEIISQIINNTESFRELIKKNWNKIDYMTLNKVTKEYLTFLMYCVIFKLQNNDLSNTELDDFTKDFYKKTVEIGLLKEDDLLDYEKLSRERYLLFYQILSEGKEKDQLEGKRLNALVAKEVLLVQKLLSTCDEKENALGELYPELFSAYNGLMLQTQLMFSENS